MPQDNDTNSAILCGQLVHPFIDERGENGELFYRSALKIKRLSDNTDTVQLLVPEKVMRESSLGDADHIEVCGTVNVTRNEHTFPRWSMFVEASSIKRAADSNLNKNDVYLSGVVRCAPKLRTPNAGYICDLLIQCGQVYIPCIVWHELALLASQLEIDDHVALTGRFQSRTFEKREGDAINEYTTHEISVFFLKIGERSD